jgi:hypothetical protein
MDYALICGRLCPRLRINMPFLRINYARIHRWGYCYTRKCFDSFKPCAW